MLAVSRECPDRVAQIVPSPLTLNWDATIRQMLQSGEIGELRELNFVKTMPAGVDASAPLTWRQDSRYSGHNMMMLGIYYEGARRWVERDPKWVWAKGKVFTTSRMDPESGQPASIEIPETISLVGEYEDGAWISGHMSVLELGPCRDGFHINGSKGCLRLDVSGDRLFKTALGGKEEEVMIPQEQKRGWQVEAEFIASIKQGAPVLHFGGPLTIGQYGSRQTMPRDPDGLSIRQSGLRLMIGTRGLGEGAFAACSWGKCRNQRLVSVFEYPGQSGSPIRLTQALRKGG